MKILCVADHVDPLVYSNSVKERFKDVEFIVSAGDLPMEYLGFIVSSLNKPLYFVFGNHNLKHLGTFNRKFRPNLPQLNAEEYHKQKTFGATYVGFKVRRHRRRDIIVAGLGGCKKYNNGLNQYSEFHMKLKILKLIPKLIYNRIRWGRYLDIFLTHAAPKGIHDKDDACHEGFECFKWFMRVFKPRYMLHGHIHLYDNNARRKSVYHSTTIINVYDHYVLDYERRNNEK